jgi:RNA polymerase sigma-70 factor (ECF subfamily)
MADPANEGPSDEALIARWRGGEERAATTLVERHAAALARFAASQGVREQVEELVQDTFVKAFGSLDGFRGEASFRTWLFTILRRLVLDRRRSERREREVVELTDTEPASGFGALDRLVAEETETRVHVALARLSRLQREVFTLRVSEGLSYKDIAKVLDSTEGAARVHYHHALQRVKEALDE